MIPATFNINIPDLVPAPFCPCINTIKYSGNFSVGAGDKAVHVNMQLGQFTSCPDCCDPDLSMTFDIKVPCMPLGIVKHGKNGSLWLDTSCNLNFDIGNFTGFTGPIGPPGADGADGARGSKGDQGDPGSTGARGSKGEPGGGGTGYSGNLTYVYSVGVSGNCIMQYKKWVLVAHGAIQAPIQIGAKTQIICFTACP